MIGALTRTRFRVISPEKHDADKRATYFLMPLVGCDLIKSLLIDKDHDVFEEQMDVYHRQNFSSYRNQFYLLANFTQ